MIIYDKFEEQFYKHSEGYTTIKVMPIKVRFEKSGGNGYKSEASISKTIVERKADNNFQWSRVIPFGLYQSAKEQYLQYFKDLLFRVCDQIWSSDPYKNAQEVLSGLKYHKSFPEIIQRHLDGFLEFEVDGKKHKIKTDKHKSDAHRAYDALYEQLTALKYTPNFSKIID